MISNRHTSSSFLSRAFVVSLVFAGCSAAVESDRTQCVTDQDCGARGKVFAGSKCVANLCVSPNSESVGPWACLGDVIWPGATAGSSHNVSIVVADIITGKPVPGLAMQVCYKLDITCQTPLLPNLVSDAEGRVSFAVPSGFDGFMESTGPEAFPFSYFFYPPVTADREIPNVPVLQPAAMTLFSSLVGVELMPDRGHILARVYNCQGKTAEGVRYTTSAGDGWTVPFYMLAGIPSTRQSATDSAGSGGLLNVPAGSATVIGNIGDNGQTLGKPESVVVRAGKITYTAVVPSP